MQRHKTILSAAALAAALACGLTLPGSANAQAITNSSLYYRLGGRSPYGGTLNKSQLKLTLGMTLRLNYSCGKFDISLSWTNLMNQIKQLGGQIDDAIQAGIAALPMYILYRAEPGLYQLFTTYSAKADLLDAAALKTCEQMEQEINRGGNPYEDFVEQAKELSWKAEANAGGDVVQAKGNIDGSEEGQRAGVPWVYGSNAGGVGQPPIKPVNDLIIAGYQVTCNVTSPSSLNVNNSNYCPSDSLIRQTFATPQAMADWSTKVLGDKQIYTCNQGSDCPQQANQGSPSTGLNTTLQDEINALTPILTDVLANPDDSANLAAVSTPGFTLSSQLMEALRRMPADEQSLALGRLIDEIAMHRVVNKALMVRQVLLTGLSIPQAAAATQVQKDVQLQINRLTGYIDDLLYEWRIRKEITSQTAMTVLRESMYRDSLGQVERESGPDGKTPLMNGAVQSSP